MNPKGEVGADGGTRGAVGGDDDDASGDRAVAVAVVSVATGALFSDFTGPNSRKPLKGEAHSLLSTFSTLAGLNFVSEVVVSHFFVGMYFEEADDAVSILVPAATAPAFEEDDFLEESSAEDDESSS